jgi:hypothetical protein
MRVMKFAVVLCFTVALVMLGNYPPPVTVHGAAPKALPRLAKDSTPAYTYMPDVSPVLCANCHQTITQDESWDPIEVRCIDCHGAGGHGMGVAISAYHNSFGTPEGSCKTCHTTGGGGMVGVAPTYHKSFGPRWPMY